MSDPAAPLRERGRLWLSELLQVTRDPATRSSDPEYWDGVAELHEYLLSLIEKDEKEQS